jgi:hypothetical protein
MKIISNPFVKGAPSVFVLWSPFQIMCAISAMRQLEINDYLLFVYMPKGGERNKQMERILELYNIKYRKLCAINKYRYIYYVSRALIFHSLRYSRLFIGDVMNEWAHYVGCGFVKNGADVVYLDDGSHNLSLFLGKNDYTNNFKYKKLMDSISSFRKLCFYHNMLTIYSDVPNPLYKIKKLCIDRLSVIPHNHKIFNNAVLIIGTNIEGYCIPLNIPELSFIHHLERICDNIKKQYPNTDIYYIPHGRETKIYAEEICRKKGVLFHRSSIAIELEIIEMGIEPIAIYGFTSNALYTLKKMYPKANVTNFFFEKKERNSVYFDYVSISTYYQQNGIEWRKLPL